MLEEKQPQSVGIKHDVLFTSGAFGSRQFKAGEKVNVVPGQKEDYTKAGISKTFVERLKFEKHV